MPITFLDEAPSKITFLDEDKPKLTGNPIIDMADANKEVALAKEGISPIGILERAVGVPIGSIEKNTGIPSMPSRYAKNAMDILKGIGNTVDVRHIPETLTVIGNTVDIRKIGGNLSNYVGSRYGSLENANKTVMNDPLGVALDMTLAGGVLNAGVKAGIKAVPVTTPEQMIAKSEDIVQRILNPSKDVIADSLLKKSKIPAVEELAKVIKKAKSEQELLTSTDIAMKNIMEQRTQIFKNNNYKMTDNYISNAEKTLSKRKAEGQITESEIRQYENVIAEEKAWYVKNKENFDRLSAQERKEVLQRKTEPLLKAEQKGANTEDSRFRMQAMDELRGGLMRELEGNDPRVRELNKAWAGLKDARSYLADQAALVKQDANRGLSERLIMIAQGALNPQTAAINMALTRAKHISRLSGKAEKLMSEATKNKVSRVIEDAVSNESRPLGLPDLTPQYVKDRISGITGDLGTTRGKTFTTRGIPSKETIQSKGYVPPGLPSPDLMVNPVHSKAISIRPELSTKYQKAQSINEPIAIKKQPTQAEINIVNSKNPKDFRERNLILKKYGIDKTKFKNL